MADDGARSPARVAPNAVPQRQGSPLTKHRPSAAAAYRLKAAELHETSAIAVPHLTQKDYNPHARSSILLEVLDDATFNSISGSEDLKTALHSLHSLGTSGKKRMLYRYTTKILNMISLALSTACGLDFGIVFAFSGARGREYGSYLGVNFMPDYCAWLTTVEKLKEAVDNWKETMDYPPWSLVLGVGEHKVLREDSMAQLDSYLTTLKRYRPDLPTVHGFYVSNNELEIASFNACGMYVSPKVPVKDASGWITHVALVYHSQATRDTAITYNPKQNDFQRWDVTVGEDTLAVVPFHVGHAPGGVTFASWVVGNAKLSEEELSENYAGKEVEGFLKISWQDVGGRWTEGRLLDRAHTGEYVPGLARHRSVVMRDDYADGTRPIVQNLGDPLPVPETADEDEKAKIIALNKTRTIRRVKEVVLLESIGEPLNSAQTIRELLYVWFDSLTTLFLLHKKGIRHRDFSYGNCLMRPKHFSKGEKKTMDHTPISEIMDRLSKELKFKLPAEAEKLGKVRDPDTGETTFESSALVTDLDHGAIISEMCQGRGRVDRIGTPMFIPLELSGPEFLYADIVETARSYVQLQRRLLDLVPMEQHYKAAVGHLDDALAHRLVDILKTDESRRVQPPHGQCPIALPSGHPLLFEVQSSFWVFLFSAARALPQEKITNDNPAKYNIFCQAMLGHVVGDSTREGHRAFFLEVLQLRRILHPDLGNLEALFQRMADYLSVPWHLYPGLPEEHAIIVFQRLILSHMHQAAVKDGDASLDTRLTTARPRPTTALDDIAYTAAFSSASRSVTSNSQPASVVSIGDEMPSAPSGGTSVAGDGSLKRCHQAANPDSSVVLASHKKQKIDEHTPMRSRSRAIQDEAEGVDGETDQGMGEAGSAPAVSDKPMGDADIDVDTLHGADGATNQDDNSQTDHESSADYHPPGEYRKSKKERVRVDEKYDEVRHHADRSALAMRLKQWKGEGWYYGAAERYV